MQSEEQRSRETKEGRILGIKFWLGEEEEDRWMKMWGNALLMAGLRRVVSLRFADRLHETIDVLAAISLDLPGREHIIAQRKVGQSAFSQSRVLVGTAWHQP